MIQIVTELNQEIANRYENAYLFRDNDFVNPKVTYLLKICKKLHNLIKSTLDNQTQSMLKIYYIIK